MNYRSTMHIEFQTETREETSQLREKLEAAVQWVLEFHALRAGLDKDACIGDRETTKGWDSDAAPDDDESPADRHYKRLVAEDEEYKRLVEGRC